MKKISVLFALSFLFSSLVFARVVEKVVARINEEAITKSQLEKRKESLSVKAYQSLSGSELDSALMHIEEKTLEMMVNEIMLLERAREMGMEESKIINHYIQSFKEQNKIESDEKLDEMLSREGMAREDLIQEIKSVVIPQYVINQDVSSKLEITGSEISEYYESHPDEFLLDPEVTIENVFIPGTDNDAENNARNFSSEIRKGTAVVDAINSFGLDPGLGEPRTYSKGDLVDELERQAFTLNPGEVSDPIKTRSGFHVIRVVSVNKTGRIPLSEVKEKITEKIKDSKYEASLIKYMEDLKKQCFVKIYD